MNALQVLMIFVALQFGVLVFFLFDLYRAGVRNLSQFYFRKWWLANQIRFLVIELCTVPAALLIAYIIGDVLPQLSSIVIAALGGTAGTAISKTAISRGATVKGINGNQPRTLVDIAKAEIGVQEIKGEKHNARILHYAKQAGFAWIQDDETPWCAVFANWVLFVAGYPTTGSARAKSFIDYGIEATREDIASGNVLAVFHRGKSKSSPEGHVGIVKADDGEFISLIGGNQSNSVNTTMYRKDWRFIGYRKPAET